MYFFHFLPSYCSGTQHVKRPIVFMWNFWDTLHNERRWGGSYISSCSDSKPKSRILTWKGVFAHFLKISVGIFARHRSVWLVDWICNWICGTRNGCDERKGSKNKQVVFSEKSIKKIFFFNVFKIYNIFSIFRMV